MSYAAAVLIILIAAIVAAFATAFIHRRVGIDLRRHHHEVGSVVFLQLGVVFAVLLAFVFDEAWGQYNEAAQAIDLEVSAMHGVAMIAATLEPAQANTILAAQRAYLEAVAHQEWPIMVRNRTKDVKTYHKFEALIQDAANLRLTDPNQQDKKAEILSLLAQAHTRSARRGSSRPIAASRSRCGDADRLHNYATKLARECFPRKGPPHEPSRAHLLPGATSTRWDAEPRTERFAYPPPPTPSNERCANWRPQSACAA